MTDEQQAWLEREQRRIRRWEAAHEAWLVVCSAVLAAGWLAFQVVRELKIWGISP